MSIWFDLLVREAALLALLAALGSGLVVLLRPEAAGCSRLALAPVFGLALGSGAMVTASYFMPMRIALWGVLLPLAAASLVAAVLIARRAGGIRMPAPIDLLQVVLIVLLVASALSYPLVSQRSLGPLGYQVSDADGYTALIDGLEGHTLHEQRWGPRWDASARYAEGYAGDGYQQIGADPLAAATGLLFGWNAVDLQTALMITLLVVGGLGIFATVRGLTRSRSPAATVAALLVAGPLFYQLLIDGSEAAIAGLALIGPIALLGSLVLRDQRIEHVALLGVLAAGLLTLYPLFVPPTVLWAALVLAVVAARAARARKTSRATLLRAGRSLAIVVLLAAALSPVALARNARYWDRVATTDLVEQANQSLPKYDLTAGVIPGWVLQTREFYYLPGVNFSHPRDLLLSVVVPAFLLALMAFGVWRHRASAILLGIVPGAALLALIAYQSNDCSYCVQRNMLVLGPPAVALIGVGLAALGERKELLLKAAAVATAAAILVTAGHKSWVTARRGAQGGYALSPDLRALLPNLGGRSGTVLLEATNLDFAGAFEMPGIYNAVREAIPNRLAIATEKDPNSGLLFLGGKRRRDARYDSRYGWVMTRAGGIRTPRRTVARDGPFALQRRRGPLDVAVVDGVVLDLARHDPGGAAWVNGPLTFWVSAQTPRRAALRLEFRGRAGQRLVAPADGRTLIRTPTRLVVCVPVQGRGRLRRVRVQVRFRAIPPQPPPERFNGRYVPGHALRLAGMAAGTRPCPP